MSYLDDMTTAGLPIGWGTLLVGWDGPGKYGRLLNADQVFSFAEPLMANLPAETVAGLADSDELPRCCASQITRSLLKSARKESRRQSESSNATSASTSSQ